MWCGRFRRDKQMDFLTRTGAPRTTGDVDGGEGESADRSNPDLRRELPEAFEDLPLAPDWDEEWLFVPSRMRTKLFRKSSLRRRSKTSPVRSDQANGFARVGPPFLGLLA